MNSVFTRRKRIKTENKLKRTKGVLYKRELRQKEYKSTEGSIILYRERKIIKKNLHSKKSKKILSSITKKKRTGRWYLQNRGGGYNRRGRLKLER